MCDVQYTGVPHTELLDELQRLAGAGKDASESRLFAYVYTGNDSHFDLQKDAYDLFEGTHQSSYPLTAIASTMMNKSSTTERKLASLLELVHYYKVLTFEIHINDAC